MFGVMMANLWRRRRGCRDRTIEVIAHGDLPRFLHSSTTEQLAASLDVGF
jgi:hypothetical protein